MKSRARWGNFTYIDGKTYEVPVCPICSEPLVEIRRRVYCTECHKYIAVSGREMKLWFNKGHEKRVFYEDCIKKEMPLRIGGSYVDGCGCGKTVRTELRREPITHKWRVYDSHCRKCGRTYTLEKSNIDYGD